MSNLLNRAVESVGNALAAMRRPVTRTGAEMGRIASEGIDGILGGNRSRFAAFISYSHRDIAFARWLHGAIETYRVPTALVETKGEFGSVPRRLRPVFRDEDELAGAAELGPKLQGALAKSAALIVICSPAAARSVWVDKEIRTFKTLNPSAPVFAIIAEGAPDSADGCFPAALRHPLLPDGTLDTSQALEPLAPDIEKLGRRTAKLKLLAGLLGVDYAALYDREQHRRRRVAAVAGSAATLLIVVLTALSITAFTYAGIALRARNAAVRSERVAVSERNQAVAARDLAERRLWLAQRAAEEVRFQVASAEKSKEKCAGH